MIDPPDNSRPIVLHLAPAGSGASLASITGEVDRRLIAAGADVVPVGDVYRALAVLLREASDHFRLAVVCVDGLSATELEFFSILSRLRPRLPVYVYTDRGFDLKPAVDRGAVPAVTPQVITDALTVRPSLTVEPPRSSTPAPAPSVSETASPTASYAAEVEDLVDKDALPAEDDEGPARVPWLDYTDRPARTAPARVPAPHPGPPPPKIAPSDDEAYEPLLTQAELDALMGDDISSIAPPPSEASGWTPGQPSRRGTP